MINYKLIGLSLLLKFVSHVSADHCAFTITGDTCTPDVSTECTSNGYYLQDNIFIRYSDPECKVYRNPLPGFYENKSEGYLITCKSTGCTKTYKNEFVKPTSNECTAEDDGKFKYVGDGIVCTKINKLKSDGHGGYTVEENNYAGIPFENGDDHYLIHHAINGEVFNFDRSKTYYAVKVNSDSIIFDSGIDDSNYCADSESKIIDRKTDFCSNDSSGMYYTCDIGKCTAEYQTNLDHFESNGEPSCGCDGTTVIQDSSCSEKDNGYYYIETKPNTGLYKYTYNSDPSKAKCEAVTGPGKEVPTGYYWNGHQYNDVAFCRDNSCYNHKVEFIKECTYTKPYEFIDTGYNLAFCLDRSTLIPVHSLEGTFVLTDEDEDLSIFFTRMDTSFIYDYSKDGTIEYEGKTYNCNKGVCTSNDVICTPESNDPLQRRGCSGYYLVGTKMLYCSSKNSVVECPEQSLRGYFLNSGTTGPADKYIKCTTETNNVLKCQILTNPGSTVTTCTAGELLYVDGTSVKLCLTGNTADAIDIFKRSTKEYFMSAGLLNKSFSGTNKYYIITSEKNSLMPKTITKSDLVYKYVSGNLEILNSYPKPNAQCSNESFRNALVEFSKDAEGDTYTKES